MSFETQIGLLWIAIGVLLAGVMYMASFVYALKEQIERDNTEVRSLRKQLDSAVASYGRYSRDTNEQISELQKRCDGFVEAANRLELRSIDVSKHAKEIEELHTKVLRNAKSFDSQYNELFNRIATLEKDSANHKTSDEAICKWLNSTEADINAIRKSLADTDAMLVGTQDACGKQIGFFENRINDIAARQKADREMMDTIDTRVCDIENWQDEHCQFWDQKFEEVNKLQYEFHAEQAFLHRIVNKLDSLFDSPIQCTLTIGKQS